MAAPKKSNTPKAPDLKRRAATLRDDLARPRTRGPATDAALDPVSDTTRATGADAPTAAEPQRSLDIGEVAFPDPKIVASAISFSGESIYSLVTLCDTAVLIADVAQALACQPRCHSGKTHPERFYNTSGDLMGWLVEVCHAISDEAVNEARRRSPTDAWDRTQRLSILAASAVQNGDREETAAFVRDLVGEMEA